MVTAREIKYYNSHRGRIKTCSIKVPSLMYGSHGLQSLEAAWITTKEINSCSKILSKYTKKEGKFWVNVFPDKPITARAKESRMGAGKGQISHWVSSVKVGTILFEILGTSTEATKNCLIDCKYKLSIKTKLIIK